MTSPEQVQPFVLCRFPLLPSRSKWCWTGTCVAPSQDMSQWTSTEPGRSTMPGHSESIKSLCMFSVNVKIPEADALDPWYTKRTGSFEVMERRAETPGSDKSGGTATKVGGSPIGHHPHPWSGGFRTDPLYGCRHGPGHEQQGESIPHPECHEIKMGSESPKTVFGAPQKTRDHGLGRGIQHPFQGALVRGHGTVC